MSTIDKTIYNQALESCHKGKTCFDEKKYDVAVVHLDKAIDSIRSFYPMTLPSEEAIADDKACSEVLFTCYYTRGIARWHLKQYQNACYDIAAAISRDHPGEDIEKMKALEGFMWHQLICSDERQVTANPYYNAYLRSWAWREKRDIRKNIDGNLCVCGRSRHDFKLPITKFVVHHKTYKRVGNERLSDLVSLCEICHDFYHGKINYTNTWPPFSRIP